MANRPKLTNAQREYAQRCQRILRRTQKKFSLQALADKFGVSVSTVHHLLSGLTMTVEEWEARKPKVRKVSKTPIGYRGLAYAGNGLDEMIRYRRTSE